MKFLQAFAEFFVDKSNFDKAAKQMVADSEKTAKRIEQSFADGFKRGLGQGGETVEKIGELAGKVTTVIQSPWTAAAAVGALAVKELLASVQAAMEFDREFTKVRVLLSGAPGEIKAAREEIGRVAAGLITTAEAAGVYRKALLDSGNRQAAEEIGRVAVQLAKVTDAAPTQTVELLTAVLDATGRKFEQVGDIAGKTFDLMRRGGGDIQALGGGYVSLLDTATSLGISLEEVNAILIRLGEVAGSSPQRNVMSLNLALSALQANQQKLREQGFDLEETIKTEGVVGGLQILLDATNGTREGLRELGIAGRNGTVVLKLLEDQSKDTGKALRDVVAQQNDAGKSDLQAALAKRSASVSAELEKVQRMIQESRVAAGTSLFDAFGFNEDMPAAKVAKGLDEVAASIATVTERLRALTSEQAKVTMGSGDREFQLAAGQAELETLLKKQAALQAIADVQKRATAATKESTTATREQSEASRNNAAASAASAMELAKLARATGETAQRLGGSSVLLEQARTLFDTRNKLAVEARVRDEEALQAGVERNRMLLQSSLSTALAIAESERALDVSRARIEGRAADGLESLLALRKKAADEGARAELAALDQVTAAQLRAGEARIAEMRNRADALRERPGFRTSLVVQKQVADLDDQIAAAELNLTKLQEDAAAKRVATEQKTQTELQQLRQRAIEERRAQVVEEQRLDDQLFQHRLAMGQATIRDEIDRARLLSMDPDRSADERMRFAEQARNRERQAAQEQFEFLRSLNQATVQDAVATQQKIVDATVRGTQERLTEERKLAEAIRNLRQAAAGVAGSLVGLLSGGPLQESRVLGVANTASLEPGRQTVGALGARTPTGQGAPERTFTKQTLLDELEERRKAAREAARRFDAGGEVTRREFDEIQRFQGVEEQLGQFGGGLKGATEALDIFAKNLLVPFGDAAKAAGLGGGLPGLPELGVPTGERADDLLGAANALRGAYGRQPSTGADISGAAERAASSESLLRGLQEGAGEATSQDLSGVGRQIAQSIYYAVYDRLATDLEREAARL